MDEGCQSAASCRTSEPFVIMLMYTLVFSLRRERRLVKTHSEEAAFMPRHFISTGRQGFGAELHSVSNPFSQSLLPA